MMNFHATYAAVRVSVGEDSGEAGGGAPTRGEEALDAMVRGA